jgi:C1A family cysteine protease
MLCAASIVFSKVGTGNIFGTVAGPSGLGIASVTVTLTSATMGTRSTFTSGAGQYCFLALPPASDYELKFEMQGFKTRVRKGIRIISGEDAAIHAVLEIGQRSESSENVFTVSAAPINPDFLRSRLGPPNGKPASTDSGQGLGDRPGPQDFSYARGMQVIDALERGTPPEAYDLRTFGRVTSVKNQNPYGTCWAFASCGALESGLLPGETWNFSEDNLVLTNGFDSGGDPYNWGGNFVRATAYLVRWGGPVNESEDAYGDNSTPPGLTPRKHMQEVNWIPARASALDNDNVKNAIMQYGGAYVSMGWYDSAYKSSTASYYYNGSSGTNHGVLIVGWDDKYSAANFAAAPADNGAFIVKNSWGTTWGNSGYFYVSYYDSLFGRMSPMAVFNKAASTSNYSGIYQYDPLGDVSRLGYTGNASSWFANVFTAQATSSLSAVGFYTLTPGTSYEIYTGSSLATKTLSTRGTLAYMGYHTVTLSAPVGVTNGQPFIVAVKVTSPGTSYSIAVEEPVEGYSSAATAQPGQSYISSNGASWSDLTTVWDANANVCLKAYVSSSPETILITAPNGGESWIAGSSHDITWTSTGTIANVNIDYSTDSGLSWTSVAAATANDGSYTWTIPITPSTTCLVRVRDIESDPSDTSNAVFSIVAAAETVTAPSTPSGPSSGSPATSYAYTTGGSTSSLGHAVQYKFDWDDGSDSGWLAEGTTTASHSWSANGTYNVRAMARCVADTAVESLWSTTYAVTISTSGSGAYYNSPAQRLILTEVNWAAVSTGGAWISEVQLIDITGGSTVQVYYNNGTNRRGPFTLWTNSSGANTSITYTNILQTIDGLDSEVFAYYGTSGSLEFITQDGSHLLQASVRTYNGDYSRTFPAIADNNTNTAASGRELIIPNISRDTAYRPSVVLFNPGTESVTVEGRIIGSNGSQIGATFSRTLASHEMSVVTTEVRADTYSNANIIITVTSGTGRVMASGQTANNTTNDPAAHLAVQAGAGYPNSPAQTKVLTEVNWAAVSTGGTWVSEVQLIDMTGGSTVQVYYDNGTNRRGPFTLWSNGGSANSSITFANILDTIDGLDSEAFTYYGTSGALEFITQDGSHLIQASVRTYNGNYSRTFPALSDDEANTAALGRSMLIPNISRDTAYRPSVVLFNPSGASVTVEGKIIGTNGAQIGSTFSRVLASHQMSVVTTEVRADTYSNANILITVTAGSGRVMVSGQTANNTTNDPAAHIAVQGQ